MPPHQRVTTTEKQSAITGDNTDMYHIVCKVLYVIIYQHFQSPIKYRLNKNALKRPRGINHRSRLLHSGAVFLSNATWPSMTIKHYNGFTNHSNMCVCMSACVYDRNARGVRTVSTCGCDGKHISGHCPVTQGSEVHRTASSSANWRCASRRDLKREIQK